MGLLPAPPRDPTAWDPCHAHQTLSTAATLWLTPVTPSSGVLCGRAQEGDKGHCPQGLPPKWRGGVE